MSSKNVWDQTIFITEDQVKSLIQSQTDILIKEFSMSGEGFDNIAYLINNDIIFRFPRRAEGVDLIKKEITLLPYIAKNVTFSLPLPIYVGKETPQYPYPFMGYNIIKGNALSDVSLPLMKDLEFAKILGILLKELHSIPFYPDHNIFVNDRGIPPRLSVAYYKERLTKCVNQYENYYTEGGFNKNQLLKIIQNLYCLYFNSERKCYLHGDLYSKHIIVDINNNPRGLIDWGDAHIGHPGIDLSVCMMFEDQALQKFSESYGGVDRENMGIAIFRAFCHCVIALPYAYQKVDKGFQIWTIAMLNQAIKHYEIFNN